MNYVNTYSDLYDPAFPQSSLDLRTELLFGTTWTDVSSRVYNRAGVALTRGHPDESSAAKPSKAALQFNNRDGDLSPRNPYGPWFGLFGRNTPMRISTPAATPYLRLETDSSSYASCVERALLDITGDIDVRIDYWPSNWSACTLAAKWNVAGNQISWGLGISSAGKLSFVWSPDGTPGSLKQVTASVELPTGRLAVRATMAAASGTVTFYTAPTIGGTWTQLGAAASGTGGLATSVFASTSPLQLAWNTQVAPNGLQGAVYGFRLYNGIGGTLVASPDFTVLVPGTSTFADGQANVWVLAGTAEVSDRRYRIHAEVPAWPPRWDTTGKDIYVPIQAAGLLRRLTQGTPPVLSALYRAYLTMPVLLTPVAYWPCEDGSGATAIASALPAGVPMTVAGTASFSSNAGFVCSSAIPSLNGSTWTAPVGTGLAWSANTIRFLMQVPTAGDTNASTVARVFTGGTVARIDLIYNAGASGTLTVNCYDYTGTVVGTANLTSFALPGGGTGGCNSWPMRVGIDVQPSGSNVTVTIWSLIVGASSVASAIATVTTASVGAVTSVSINPGGKLTQTAVGHVTVQRTFSSPIDLTAPLNANAGELAAVRFARLCTEQGIAYRIIGAPADTAAMGAQPPGAFVSLLQQCEDADRGLMYEARQALAMAYRTRSSMCNQAPAVALDYGQAHLAPPLEPTDDDQFIVNDATVSRSSGSVTGSSARQYLATGSESVLAPPSGIGDYASTYPLNLATDGQAAQTAGWIVHVGTADEPRYPTITVDLTRSAVAALAGPVQDTEIGDRVTVANTPVTLPPDGISQIVRGCTELLNTFQLTEAWTTVPESPYRVGVYDDPVYGHYDTDGAQLVGTISASAVSIQVRTVNPSSPLWTTNPADFPFDIEVSPAGNSGERMTVTNITGSSSPQTFTVTRAVNGVSRSWPPGTDVRLFQPAIYAL